MVLFILSSASLLILPLFFVRSVNNILPSLWWSRAVQLVTAKRKNVAAAGGFRQWFSFFLCFCVASFVYFCFCFFFCFSWCRGCYRCQGGWWQLAVMMMGVVALLLLPMAEREMHRLL
jgi:hypothetical protein